MSADPKKSLWRRLTHQGVAPEMSIGQRRSAIVTNEFAILVAAITLLTMTQPGSARWPGSALLLVQAASYLVVPVCMGYGFVRVTPILFALSGTLWIIFTTYVRGTASGTQAYLLSVALGVWPVISPKDRRYAAAISVLSLAAYVWFEAHDVPSILVVTPEEMKFIALMNHAFFGLVLIGMAVYSFNRTHEAEDELELARRKSESLLLNVLPASIANRLKENHGSIADRFDEATILFADIVNFTVLSEKISAVELVAMLDHVFSKFDALCDRYGLEKIKTIGDAYMVAAGIPEPHADQAEAIAGMALEMGKVIAALDQKAFGSLNIRIGIHAGPVVAGVIGQRKFAYDLWGDAVNLASRMESHGAPGKIHVSKPIYEKLKGRFLFEPRGTIHVKGKGELETWFLTGRAKPREEGEIDQGAGLSGSSAMMNATSPARSSSERSNGKSSD